MDKNVHTRMTVTPPAQVGQSLPLFINPTFVAPSLSPSSNLQSTCGKKKCGKKKTRATLCMTVWVWHRLGAALVRSGRYSDEDMAKLMGGNFLRVWREVEAVAAGWSKPAVHGAETSLYTSEASNKQEAPACHYQWSALLNAGFK